MVFLQQLTEPQRMSSPWLWSIRPGPDPGHHGWARLSYPADRELHAVATVKDYRAGEKSANFTAVAPGSAFRLRGWYRALKNKISELPDGETALAIGAGPATVGKIAATRVATNYWTY